MASVQAQRSSILGPVVRSRSLSGGTPEGDARRAAQYVRMSTDHQQYSTANQQDAIARYARERGLDIVRTYADEGRSGLTFAGRPGLRALLDDVIHGRADFHTVLVFDISRWGRFQDTDESACYEYLNVCDALVAQDRVSWGLKSSDIANGVLNTAKVGSRDRNNNERGGSGSVSPILFDQILFPLSMKPLYVAGSAKVFDGASAMTGGSTNGPSDHVPVYADFVFGALQPTDPSEPVIPVTSTGLTIVELLPNPAGENRGHEEVVIANGGAASANLSGWQLRDRAGNTFILSGTVGAGARTTITLPGGSLPLNNDGDEVTLLDPQGSTIHHVSYGQAASGARLTFP
jgi:hypothetical protein